MDPNWKEERVLGQGSFGFVRLFVNLSTNDKIALKEMKVGILETLEPSEREKLKLRMKTEIKIMWEHNHDNLVKAMCCPDNMSYVPDENIIHVWMEYCDGGDLRKSGLNQPHNCCGLLEPVIRRILAHINAGLIFLHRHHIIHRDLKPENILLKKGPTGETIYKLTDFGYAKAYDSSSWADSMVGTPQYVAPEILNSQKHGRTVDFWSFGVVTFELCTGIRPFLHLAKRPFEWVGPTSGKPDDCIHISFPESGNQLIKSNRIPKPNDLSTVFEKMLTEWLQMALHYSPDRRGGLTDNSSHEDAPCLVQMDKLLRTRILTMICMSTGDILEMKINSQDSLSSIRQWLMSRGHSKPKEIYLVTSKGQIISPEDNVDNVYKAFFQPEVYTATVYLYTTVLQPSFKLVQNILPTITKLFTDGDEKILGDDKVTTYGHVYYHLREYWRLFDRLHSGHKSIVDIISGTEDELRSLVGNDSLLVNYCMSLGAADEAILSVSKNCDMLQKNNDTLKQFEAQCNIQQSFEKWSTAVETMTSRMKEMRSALSEVQRVQKEADEVLTTTEVMNQRHICSERHFEEFHVKYVKEALRYYRAAKINDSHGSMSELLQLAMNQAENIIQDDLNGVDYLSVYLKMSALLQAAKAFTSKITDMKRESDDMVSSVRNNMWSMILTSTRRPSSLNMDGAYATQMSDSLFGASLSRNDSIASNTSTSSSRHIIQRLYSSQSTGGSSEESDGPADMDSLMGSLREHMLQQARNNQTVMARNKTILSMLDDHPGNKHNGGLPKTAPSDNNMKESSLQNS